MSRMAQLLDSSSSSFIIAGGLAVIYILAQLVRSINLSLRRYHFKRDAGCKTEARYPHIETIFGLDLFIDNLKLLKTGGFLNRIQERYNKMSKLYGTQIHTYSSVLTGDRVIQTCEPENIKAMLATQFKDFDLPSMRKVALGPIFGHGIFTTDGQEWEASRALLRPNFNRSQVGDIAIFENHLSKLIKRIPTDGSTFDIQPMFFMLTMDSATEFLFGHSAGSLDTGKAQERGLRFARAFTDSTEIAGTIARLGRLGFVAKNKKYREDVKYVHEYVQEYVQKAVFLAKAGAEKSEKNDDEKSKYVFLEELAKTGYSEKKIQDELLNILLAGRDTTASLLSYVFYTLAREPRVFEKLRAEVLALGDDKPTFEQIKSCKYLQWTLNEALRMLPIVPLNSRMAVRDTTLPVGGGPNGRSPIFVKAGQNVNYQVYIMHRRKDLYGEDADKFKPERWETFRPGWNYIPFNGGPRICIGQQFALIEASYTTIRLLQHFKNIEKREDSEFKELLTLTAAVRGGVQIGLTPA